MSNVLGVHGVHLSLCALYVKLSASAEILLQT